MFIDNLTDLIGSGAQADVYRLGNKAVKVFKAHSPKMEAFCEAAVHAMVEHTQLPIPKIYEVIQYDNRMAIVMDLIEGPSLKELIFNNQANSNAYIDLVVDLHIKVHKVNALGLPNMKDRLAWKITKSILDSPQKEKLMEMLYSFEMGTNLGHGDFHFLNLIMTAQGIRIIDWVDATCGSPEADLCRTYMLYLLYAPDSFADMYLDAYCRKQQIERNSVLKWLPVIAGARLSEKNKSEYDKLIRWVDKIM